MTEKEIAEIPNEADVQKAQWVLHSPVDGLVTERSANPGEVVQARHTLLVIGQDDPLWVNASVKAWEFALLKDGPEAQVSFPPDTRTVNVRVQAINPEIDKNTATVRFWMPIPNHDHRLSPGQLVQVQLDNWSSGSSGSSPLQPPAEARSDPSIMERLNEVERKIDQLLKQKRQGPSDSGILQRLDQIEQAESASRRPQG